MASGAHHHVLLIRSRVLSDELADDFHRGFPAFTAADGVEQQTTSPPARVPALG